MCIRDRLGPLQRSLTALRRADVIGMSGLLVKSTLIMRDNLEELNDRHLAHIPVLLGGAALTRTYVERDLRTAYTGRVFYGRDAFEGLRTMDRLMEIKGGDEDPTFGREISERKVPARSGLTVKARPENVPDRSPEVATDNPVTVGPSSSAKPSSSLILRCQYSARASVISTPRPWRNR